ncbi:MAG TPA: type VI secretion system baseplate subunit TssF [Polyangiaceae bacterium]|nr:type VI secretion system baseplate subunit TssF [Polyangiaceae bacterium]
MSQDAIERAFLTELESLEKFRISYTAQFPAVPLSHDDPDVRRLIEAMAYFTARTRIAALRGLDDSVQRIFRQHFPSLLGPSPALAMLRATPKASFVEPAYLPRGTEVLLTSPSVDGAPEQIFRFKTLAELRVLPLEVRSVEMVALRGRGYRLLIRLVASHPTNAEVRSLSLHVNHLDDLRSSVTVLQALKDHALRCSVSYDPRAPEDAPGKPCSLQFGLPEEADAVTESFEHPLQRARLRLRFPRQELFLNFHGMPPSRNWQHLTLAVDLSPDWPRKLRLTSDDFELHTVPMLNLQRELANPIRCDGTKDRYPVLHPDAAGKYVPTWVIAAQRPTKQGFVPLEPGVVGVSGDSYEVVTDGSGEDRRAWLILNLKSAFESPQVISADAFWHQPGLRTADQSALRVGLHAQFVDGLEWALSGAIVPDADCEIDEDRDAQLELVSLKTLRFLGHPELLSLLRALGVFAEKLFAPLARALADVRVTNKPMGQRSHGLKYRYELRFDSLELTDLPRLALFCSWLLDVLVTWSAEEVIEIEAKVPNLGRPLLFERGLVRRSNG